MLDASSRPLRCLGALAVLSAAVRAAGAESPAEALLGAGRPLVIAHRGYSHIAPENTLPAFELAKAAGADLVELDYHHARDGVPIVIHDAELDRTTDAAQKWGLRHVRVDSRTADELRSLDAGKWFDATYAGTRLPLLAEALDAIQDGGVTLIERKAGDAATCVKLLRERNLVNRVVVQSFDWEYLRDFHAREPRQVLAALGPPAAGQDRTSPERDRTLDRGWVDEARLSGARVVVWDRRITREAVEYAHDKGVEVWVYTIDDPVLAGRMLEQGVDGIITNNPSLIWRAIALRRLGAVRQSLSVPRGPPPRPGRPSTLSPTRRPPASTTSFQAMPEHGYGRAGVGAPSRMSGKTNGLDTRTRSAASAVEPAPVAQNGSGSVPVQATAKGGFSMVHRWVSIFFGFFTVDQSLSRMACAESFALIAQ